MRWWPPLSWVLIGILLAPLGVHAAPTDAAKRQFEIGLQQSKAGALEEAIQAFKRATELDPRFADAHYQLGLHLLTGKKSSKDAGAAFRQAVAVNPSLVGAHYELAMLALNEGHVREAEQGLERVIELAPKQEQAYLDLGKLYERKHASEQAVATYLALLKVDTEHPEALYRLAVLGDARGDAKLTQSYLDRLLRARPKHYDAWYLKGRIAERNNDLAEAANAYRQAVQAKPDLIDARFNLAFILRSQGRSAEAAREFLEVIVIKPEHAEAHMNLGLVYTTMKKLDDAEHEYEAAVNLNPNLSEAHYNLGVFYELYRKDMPRALAQYRRYRDLGGRDDRVERIVGQAGR